MKAETLQSLVKKLDNSISTYVRLNAADSTGRCQCISCPVKYYWQLMDCAHYIPRVNMATRFYLPNLSVACKHCNSYDKENHILKWKVQLTDEVRQDLLTKSHSMMKWTKFELVELIKFYNKQSTILRKQKNL